MVNRRLLQDYVSFMLKVVMVTDKLPMVGYIVEELSVFENITI